MSSSTSHLVLLLLAFLVGVVRPQCAPDNERIDCFPEPDANQEACEARGCTWCESQTTNIPWCYTGEDWGYVIEGDPVENDKGVTVTLNKVHTGSYYGDDSPTIYMDFEYHTDDRLRIKIHDGTDRWEPPVGIPSPDGQAASPKYSVVFNTDGVFSFQVQRASTGAVLYDTSMGGLTFSNQYLQIGVKLPLGASVYGIGENEQHSFKHDMNYITYPLFARDQPPGGTTNMYGVHPYYTVLESDGNAYSVLMLNSNAQQFKMVPDGVIYQTIGGILDIYLFLGPEPESVVQQYTEAIGRSFIPPYFSMGFQLCRYGYNTLENMQAAQGRCEQYGIPQDVQYGDIDIMDRALDFTLDTTNFGGLPDYITEMKGKGIQFFTILDPCISTGEPAGSYPPYDSGNTADAWVKTSDGSYALGQVWPEDPTYFPDYSRQSAKDWWISEIVTFKDLLDWEGLWIDMNEPANFVAGSTTGCADNTLNNPPFKTNIAGGSIYDKTLCMDFVHDAGLHYDTHSMYGWYQSEPTLDAVRQATNKRAIVLSRSTFPGSGRWVAHWLGDNFSQWSNLYYSIIGMLQFNQFGIPMVGSDICGFIGDSNADMCQRWQQLGAFYPFSRNHNGIGYAEQDPGAFGETVAAVARDALLIRYRFLPYLYTLFYNAATAGNTVARPLWHEFPTDSTTASVDRQFMWGSGLLISPALDEGQVTVDAYFPAARWFSYYDGSEQTAGAVTLDVPMDFIPLHIRGGAILPMQEPDVTTEISRQNPLGLMIGLDESGSASGSMFYDDGNSQDPVNNGAYYLADFSVSAGSLTSTVVSDTYDMSGLMFDNVVIYGEGAITSVTVNGAAHTEFTQDATTGAISITNAQMAPGTAFTVTWS